MSDRDREEEDREEEENRLQVKVSKYERERQKKALMKRKEQFESETGVLGRQLDGPAFESTPRVIEFKDFGLNEPHLLTIILTNISPAANYFKVLPIEDEFRDYFEIFYVPPGKMSAGISSKVTVKFTPQLNQNINTSLPLMTGSGRMAIPIVCSYRKAVVNAKSTVIDFGDVLYGEDKEMHIELENFGALETMLKVKDAYGRSLKDKTEGYSTFSRQMSVVSESRSLLTSEQRRELETR